ncbi:L-seryl-tRNA(Sec) selenium transferase [Alkalibacter rhizosphaerae]|uniref:L-seryl-tRNA(Sec) selenium transferase n=1 Tax=Alkalibacter rhizosphaerae TaxID=2815577 RepID=A0A974XEA1_9FIRM|nr:L-seryl-tRNA(Sec) selenium transferase [Alkalibacter rhizosphaerae]QSX08264.1 L-seryl-tRNA(Sec) selenium transferase [Alkalibacter rhizosphaerae]
MKISNFREALRHIPAIHVLIQDPSMEAFAALMGRNTVLTSLRRGTEQLKASILSDPEYYRNHKIETSEDLFDHLMDLVLSLLEKQRLFALQPVINATGVVLHTNLGRAPLSQETLKQVMEVSTGYSNLEYDLDFGKRGSRYDHMEELLCRLTGAEAAMVVNNNAGAVFLCLNTFAKDKEVIVSRGEQVEIGGSFRVPEIIKESGCILKEVGTTNKTKCSDYEEAITENTSILLKVHTSNYKIIGFTSSVSLAEISIPEDRADILCMEDLGSGCLTDLSLFDLPREKTPMDSLKEGADLVTFSGDKLLGGAQAGIILGKRSLVEKIKKNHLARILRCDKMTIAALHSVLQIYDASEDPVSQIPSLTMLCEKIEVLEAKAKRLRQRVEEAGIESAALELLDVEEEAGGGSLPGVVLQGKAVALVSQTISPDDLRNRLRRSLNPIVCRISEDRVLFHVRTIREEEFDIIATELKKCWEAKP